MNTETQVSTSDKSKPVKSTIRSGVQSLLQQVKQLNLGTTLGAVRSELLLAATNKELLSSHYLDALKPASSGVPYHISPTEPDSIQIFKKVANIIHNAEHAIKNIEKINLDDEESLLWFTAKNGGTVASSLYQTVTTFNDALDLINHSGENIQAIFGPQMERLAPQIEKVGESLSQVTPSKSVEDLTRNIGAVAGTSVNMLATSDSVSEVNSFESIAGFVSDLPGMMAKMTALIQSDSGADKKSVSSVGEHHQKVSEQANKLALRMQSLAKSSSYIKYGKLVSQLAKEAIDIAEATGPLTRATYSEVEKKLNHFRHDLMPELMAEIGAVEQSTGLRPGTLSAPVLKSVNQYYQKAVDALDKNAKIHNKATSLLKKANLKSARAARKIFHGSGKKFKLEDDIIHNSDLSELTDHQFEQTLQKKQESILKEAQISLLKAKTKGQAFDEFMDLLEKENTFLNDGQMSYINPEKKMELGILYAQCQEYVHAHDEALDKKIVTALHLSERQLTEIQEKSKEPVSTSFWSQASSALATTAWGALIVAKNVGGGAANTVTMENDFVDVFQQQKAISTRIQKDIANKELRVDMIEESIQANEVAIYDKHQQKTILQSIASFSSLEPYLYNPHATENELYEHSVKTSYRLKDINKAQSAFTNFNNNLKTYQQQGITGIASLSEEQKEALRKDYIHFQPYMYHLANEVGEDYLEELDTQLVSSLMSDDDAKDIQLSSLLRSSTGSDSLDLETQLDDYLNNQETIFKHNVTKYSKQLIKQIQTPQELKEFKTEKRQIKTLVQELADQKLSAKTHDFLHSTIIPALKENLSEEILESLNIDDVKLPYKIGETEDDRVKLYKELVNSFHHLEKGLSNFESAAQQDSASLLSKPWFYGKTLGYDVGKPLSSAVKSLKKTSKNPKLATVLSHAKSFLEPLRSHPMLSSGQSSKVSKSSDNALGQLNSAANGLRHDLFNLTHTKKEQLITDIDHAINLYDHEFKQFMANTTEAQTTFAKEVGLSKEAITQALLNIQVENRTALRSQIKTYENTIEHSPPHPDWEKIEPLSQQLNQIMEEANENGGIFVDTIPNLQAVYEQIRPFLDEAVEEQFTEDYFLEGGSVSLKVLAEKVDELNKELDFSFAKPPGPFDKLNGLYYDFDTDFSDKEVQDEIKQHYDALQPYLYNFDEKYTTDYIDNLIDQNNLEQGLGDMVKRDFQPAQEQAILDLLAPTFQQSAHDVKTFMSFLSKSQSKELLPFYELNQILGDSRTDFDSPETQQQIKNQLAKIQPLLEKVDPKYHAKHTDNLETAEDYRKLLNDIVRTEFPKVNEQLVNDDLGKHHPHRDLFLKTFSQLQATKLDHAPKRQTELAQEEGTSKLKEIITNMYRLPETVKSVKQGEQLKGLKPISETDQQKVEEVMVLFSQANFQASGLGNYMKVLDEVGTKLRESGVEVNDVMMEHLPNLRDEYITNVVIETDKMELELGLRPGTLSEPLNNVFDSFYSGLVQHITQLSDQNDLALQIGTINIDLRMDASLTRLKSIEKNLQKVQETLKNESQPSDELRNKERSLLLDQKLCQHQISHLNDLKKAKTKDGLDKINHYKSLVFQQKLQANVRSDLDSKEKGVGTQAIFNLLTKELNGQPKPYMEKLTLMDDIDAGIEKEVMQAYQDLYRELKQGNFESEKLEQIRGLEKSFDEVTKQKESLLNKISDNNPFRKAIESHYQQIKQFIEKIDAPDFDNQVINASDRMSRFIEQVPYYQDIKGQVIVLDKQYQHLMALEDSATLPIEKNILQEQRESLVATLENVAQHPNQPIAKANLKLQNCTNDQKIYESLYQSAQVLEQISTEIVVKINKIEDISEQEKTPQEQEELEKLKILQQQTEGFKKLIQDKNIPLSQRVNDLQSGIVNAVGPEMNKPEPNLIVRLFKKVLSFIKSLFTKVEEKKDTVKEFKERLMETKVSLKEHDAHKESKDHEDVHDKDKQRGLQP